MAQNKKYLYAIKNLKIENWIKWWLLRKGSIPVDYVLGELMTGTDITINNTVEKKFFKFDLKGNSTQDGTPTPDSPVEIYSAGDNGSISEKIINKNLYNPLETYTTGFTNQNIAFDKKVKQSQAYIFNTVNKPFTFVSLYNSNNVLTRTLGNTNTTYKVSFTPTSSEVKAVCGFYAGNNADVTTYDFTGIQLELGSSETSYVAHQEQTYTIPVQQPMRSIGTVRDEFIENNERHYYSKRLFVGATTGEYWVLASTDTNTARFYIEISDITDGLEDTMQPKLISNYFTPVTFRTIYSNDVPCIAQYGGTNDSLRKRIYLRIDKTIASTVAELKTWLSTHNVEVIYQLATPVDLPCTSEQIAILENLPKSYNEQTNIYSLDVTPGFVEAQSYVKKEGE